MSARLSLGGAPGNPRLSLGAESPEWPTWVWGAARTAAPRAVVAVEVVPLVVVTATVAARTAAPQAAVALFAGPVVDLAVAARTAAPRARVVGRVEAPWVLSDFSTGLGQRWQAAGPVAAGTGLRWQRMTPQSGAAAARWQAAAPASGTTGARWRLSARVLHAAGTPWQAAGARSWAAADAWCLAARAFRDARPPWQAAAARSWAAADAWHPATRTLHAAGTPWQAAGAARGAWVWAWSGAAPIRVAVVEVWQPAGYPGRYVPGPDLQPGPLPTPWGARLCLSWPVPEAPRLSLGRHSCRTLIAYTIPVRRVYVSLNTASLVRWPDLTPLPVVAMTLETDFSSWCWALSATLVGADAWALVAPDPDPVEVLATVNGTEWKFVLDAPTQRRQFNSRRVELRGRSRSAWLAAPYAAPARRDSPNAREMVQLAEEALALTGWTLDWRTDNWVVPAGRYQGFTTPIEALLSLVKATDDGLYTDPAAQTLTVYPKWPAPGWLLDAELAAVAVPAAALLQLEQTPLYAPAYTGVYVSGTTAGALALVRVEGTSGALQPPDPLVHELLCDAAGVAARRRGLNFLSDAGTGYAMTAETLFNPEADPAFPLVPPGQIVSLATVKGVSRGVRVRVAWNDGLRVQQSISLERRAP